MLAAVEACKDPDIAIAIQRGCGADEDLSLKVSRCIRGRTRTYSSGLFTHPCGHDTSDDPHRLWCFGGCRASHGFSGVSLSLDALLRRLLDSRYLCTYTRVRGGGQGASLFDTVHLNSCCRPSSRNAHRSMAEAQATLRQTSNVLIRSVLQLLQCDQRNLSRGYVYFMS